MDIILTEKEKERFWSKVSILGPDDCWEWIAGKQSDGYGKIYLQKSFFLSHRIAAHLSGYNIDGLHVLHSCDNPPCCNPAHLRTGTHTDNMRDKGERKRHAVAIHANRGELNKMSKITKVDRDSIISDTRVYRVIAADYSISAAQVCRIKKGLRWAK